MYLRTQIRCIIQRLHYTPSWPTWSPTACGTFRFADQYLIHVLLTMHVSLSGTRAINIQVHSARFTEIVDLVRLDFHLKHCACCVADGVAHQFTCQVVGSAI